MRKKARSSAQLRLTLLEDRSVPATLTWLGAAGGGNDNWSDPANWVGGTPTNGDTLVFDSATPGLVDFTSNNDISNLTVGALQITDSSAASDFSLTGNAIALAGNIDQNLTSGTQTTIAFSAITLSADVTLTSTAGLVVVSAPVDLAGQTLTEAGAGDASFTNDVTGNATTSVGLQGNYFGGITAGDNLFDPNDPAYLGNKTPTATVQTPQINFPSTGGNPYTPIVDVGSDNVAARWVGEIDVPTTGPVTFYTTSDDGSVLLIDGTEVVNNRGSHGMNTVQGTVASLTAGKHTFEVMHYEGGGGAGIIVEWDPGTGRTIIPASAFSSPPGHNQLVKQGAGTLTLSGNNTFIGTANVQQGRVVAASATALGSTAAGTTVSAGATLEFAGVSYAAAEPVTLAGGTLTGSGTASFAGPVTVSAAGSTVSSATGADFTLSGAVTANGGLTVAAGANSKLDLTGAVTLNAASTLTAAAGASLTVDGDVAENAPLTVNGAGNVTVNGDLSGALSVFATGGLTGNYYSGISSNAALLNPISNLQALTPAATVLTPRIDFGDGTDTVPGDGSVLDRSGGGTNHFGGLGINLGGTNNLAGLWSGKIVIPMDGNYRFTTRSDDGSVLYIDGVLVVDNNFDQGMTNRFGDIALTAGNHDIVIGYRQGGGGWGMQASWELLDGPTFARRIIEPDALGTIVVNSLTYSGTGTLNLNGDNAAFAAPVNVTSGTVVAGSPTALGATSAATTVSAGATLEFAGVSYAAAEPVTLAGGTLTGSGTASFAGPVTVSAAGSTVSSATGADFTLSGAVTANSGVTVAAGANSKLDLAGTVTLNAASTLTATGGGSLTVSGALTANSGVTVAAGANSKLDLAGTVTLNAASTLTADSGATLTVDGDMSSNFPLTVNGAGAVTVNGDLSGVGSNFVSGGLTGNYYTLAPGGGNTPLLAPISTLQALTPTTTVLTPRIDFGDGTESIPGDGTVLDRGGNGANHFGGLGVNVGTSDIAGLWSDQIYIATAGTYEFTTRSDDGSVLYIDGNLVANNNFNQGMTNRFGDIALTAGYHNILIGYYQGGGGWGMQASWALLDGPTFARRIIEPGVLGKFTPNSLTYSGTGTFTLNGDNTYAADINVTSGTLVAGSPNALGSTAAGTTVAAGATLGFGDGLINAEPVTSAGTLAGVGADGDFSGPLTITADATFDVAAGNILTLSGTITDGAGTFGLVKQGAGTLVLATTTGYNGPTTVSAGDLIVIGNTTSTATTLTGGTLGGTGTVGVTDAKSGSSIAPGGLGGGAGNLTVNGSFALEAGSSLNPDIGGATAGTKYDRVRVVGSVTLGGALNLTLTNGFVPTVGQKFTVIDNDGTDAVIGTFSQGSTVSVGAYTFAINYAGGTGNDVVLTLTTTTNSPPVNTVPATATTNEDTPLAFTGLKLISVADSDAGSSAIRTTVSVPSGQGTLTVVTVAGLTVTNNGTNSVQLDGTLAAINAGLTSLVYTPPIDANITTLGGTVTLTVLTNDLGNTGSDGPKTDTDTVAITITPVNDNPSFALPTTIVTVSEGAGPITVSGFATTILPGPLTATDEALQGLTFTLIPVVNSGNLTFSSAPAIDASGNLTFTTTPFTNGTATVTVTVTDSGGGTSVAHTFQIIATAVNDLPVAQPSSVTTNEDTVKTFAVSDFLYTDVENNALTSITVSGLALASGDTLTVDQGAGAVTVTNGMTITAAQILTLKYTPAGDQNGAARSTFNFTVNDADLGTQAATMSINVTAVNDVPVALASSVTTTENTAKTFATSDFSFFDAEGNSLTSITVSSLSLASGDTLTVNQGAGIVTVANGMTITAAQIPSLTYTPAPSASGAARSTFSFKVNDTAPGTVAATMSITVTPNVFGTTTSLGAAPGSSVYGQVVTLTATVTPDVGGTPATGTVTFMDGATVLGVSNVSGGVAVLNTSTLSLGARSLTAVYNGDAHHTGSTSTATGVTVGQAGTTVTLSGTGSPATVGEGVSFQATVAVTASGAGSPTGVVIFRNGATILATVPVIGGVAIYTTTTLPVGSDNITATYNGDINFSASSVSNTVTEVVNKATTTTVLEGPSAATVTGESAIFVATVNNTASGSGTPTGTVTFRDGGTTIAIVAVNGGVAVFSTSNLSVASHSITATYNGDNNFTASAASNTVTQLVNKASTTVTLFGSGSAITVGQSASFTATVSVTAPGSGVLTGTITFSDGATPVATIPVVNGVAVWSTTNLGVGSHSITASYDGTANFAASPASTTVTQLVNQASTTVTLSGSGSPTTAGQNVTFSASVNVTAPGSGVPSGTVTFSDGGTPVVTLPVVNGVAVWSTTGLAVGSHSITASYDGTTNYAASPNSNTITQQINSGGGGGGGGITANGDVFSLPENSPATAFDPRSNDTGTGITITAVTQPVSGTVVITGVGTGVTYQPHTGFSGVDSFTYTISDGTNTSTATVIVSVTAVNQAPTINAPASAVMFVNASAPLTGVSIIDADSGSGQEKVTLSTAGFGTLSLGTTAGLTFTVGDGTADATMTFTGTVTAINNALSGLTYRGNVDDATNSDTITIGIDDQGNTGAGGPLTASATINVAPNFGGVQLLSDPFKAGTNALVVTGTNGLDTITVLPNGSVANSFKVTVNGVTQIVSGVTGRVLVFGQDNNDTITVSTATTRRTFLSGGNGDDKLTGGAGIDYLSGGAGNNILDGGTGTADTVVETGDFSMTLTQGTTAVNGSLSTTGAIHDVLVLNHIEQAILTGGASGNTLDASLFTGNTTLIGGAGNDTLKGGTKNNILVGNAGNDTLRGGAGKNVMIGGLGTDTLVGGANQDLLIGGTTAFDDNIAALNGIMLEWGGTTVYATKIKHLLGTQTGGKNIPFLLTTSTVHSDGQGNTLTGGGGLDWFFKSSTDTVTDANTGGTETITSIP